MAAGAKVAVVTGSNQGIGYGLVRRLCNENPDWIVYLTARSEEKGLEAVAALEKEGVKQRPRFHQLDITDIGSVRKLKEDLQAEHGGIDVLVNNAGMAFKTADTSSYALKAEVTLQTNFFCTRAVFDELFSLFRDGARIVNVASMTGEYALKKVSPALRAVFTQKPPLTCDEISQYMEKFVSDVKSGDFASQGWPDDSAYSISKLGLIVLSFAQQEVLTLDGRKDLVVNSCCPGYVGTNMSSFMGPKTIDEGADTLYYLATLPPGTPIKGKYVSERQVKPWE